MTRYNLPFNVNDIESVSLYAQRLKALRKQALARPLRSGLVFTCNLSTSSEPIGDPANSRLLPSFAFGEGAISFRLDKPLKVGVDRWSQVWLAQIFPDVACGTMSSSLVVKFVQPSLLPIPDPHSLLDIGRKYRIPEEVALREAESYHKLGFLQGSIVPYFFGLQQLAMPSGEIAWVLLLEYVKGPTIQEVFEEPEFEVCNQPRPESLSKARKIYKHVMEGLHRIHSIPFTVQDVRLENIVLHSLSEIVFIDWSMGDQVSNELVQNRERHQMSVLFNWIPTYGSHVVTWGNTHLPPEIMERVEPVQVLQGHQASPAPLILYPDYYDPGLLAASILSDTWYIPDPLDGVMTANRC